MEVSQLLFPSGSLSVAVDVTSEVLEEFVGRHTSFGYQCHSIREQSGVETTAAAAGVCSDGYDTATFERFRNQKGSDITFAVHTEGSFDYVFQVRRGHVCDHVMLGIYSERRL